MAQVLVYLKKNVAENAAIYFEKAKKAKKKMQGAQGSLKENADKLQSLLKKQEKHASSEEEEKKLKERKKEWYEKFRWFFSSEGFLVIGGRDATSNEVVIKKYTESGDIVFHTDLAGSPFFVVKTEGRTPGGATIKEVADATVTFSRVFKLGQQNSPVFWVRPEQISKQAQSGEYLTKGAFMVRGKANYIENKINLAVGMTNAQQIMAGPVEAVKKHCEHFLILEQGSMKPSDAAKKIKSKLGGSVDEIIRALPAGGFKVVS